MATKDQKPKTPVAPAQKIVQRDSLNKRDVGLGICKADIPKIPPRVSIRNQDSTVTNTTAAPPKKVGGGSGK